MYCIFIGIKNLRNKRPQGIYWFILCNNGPEHVTMLHSLRRNLSYSGDIDPLYTVRWNAFGMISLWHRLLTRVKGAERIRVLHQGWEDVWPSYPTAIGSGQNAFSTQGVKGVVAFIVLVGSFQEPRTQVSFDTTGMWFQGIKGSLEKHWDVLDTPVWSSST